MSNDFLQANLYDHPVNKENLDFLLKDFDKSSFVAFLGAGLPANSKRMPDWPELYESLKQRLNIRCHKKFEGQKSFSNLYKRCSSKNDYFPAVFEITRLSGSPPSIYVEIMKAFNIYATINFSDCMESACAIQGTPLDIMYFSFSDTKKNEKLLIYLHGHEKVGFCVLREEDYAYFYPSLRGKNKGVSVVEASLKRLFLQHRIVFLGFGFEAIFKEYFPLLCESSVTNPKEHFWIAPASNLSTGNEGDKEKQREKENNFFNSYHKMRIRPILYTGDHIYLDYLCTTFNKNLTLNTEQPDPSVI